MEGHDRHLYGLQLKFKWLWSSAVVGLMLAAVSLFLRPISFLDPALEARGIEYVYRGSTFTGFLFERFPSGALHRLTYVWQGKRIYKEIHWYANGQRWAERDYRRGIPHGEFKQWYENGRPKSIAYYKDGLAEGEMWVWDKHGGVNEFRLSKAGEEVAYKAFTFDQKTYYNYVYRDGERVGVQAGEFCKTGRRAPKL